MAARCFTSYRVAVVYEHYDPVSVVAALRKALEDLPAARTLLDAARAAGAAGAARRRCSRCATCCSISWPDRASRPRTAGPLLLIVDDLERLLDESGGGVRHRVKSNAVPVLHNLLDVFEVQRSRSRLLLTSRYTFTLSDGARDLADKLDLLQLGSLPEAAQRKLVLREEQRAETEAGLAKDDIVDRRGRLERARVVARGNPGLQDLLAGLVLGGDPDQAERALAELEAYLARGDLPSAAQGPGVPREPRARPRLVDPGQWGGPRAVAPSDVVRAAGAARAMAAQAVISALLGLGLLERFEDLVKPPRAGRPG